MGLEAVAEVSVVAERDARLGEHAAAVVTVRPGTSVPTLDQVRDHLAAVGLARQKWPESIHEVAAFPRTPSGKVQKFRLRELLAEGAGDGPHWGRWTVNRVHQEARTIAVHPGEAVVREHSSGKVIVRDRRVG